MRQFYEKWQILDPKSPAVADEMQATGNEVIDTCNSMRVVNRPPTAVEMDWNDFFSIGFSHHDEILSKFGQLQGYLRVLDDDERFPFENPSMGLILCREADKAYVEYVLQDYNRPMGVATYRMEQQQKLMDVLPDEDRMKALIVSDGEKMSEDNIM